MGIRTLSRDILEKRGINLTDFINIVFAPVLSQLIDNREKLQSEFENYNILPTLRDVINIDSDNRATIVAKIVENYDELYEKNMVICY